jgi:hypothetical protein
VDAELVDVLAEDRHEFGRDGHRPDLIVCPMLETQIVVSLPAVRPFLVGLRLGLGEDEPAPASFAGR